MADRYTRERRAGISHVFLRLDRALHHDVKRAAIDSEQTVTAWVEAALSAALDKSSTRPKTSRR